MINRLYTIVNRLYTMINKLFTIINQFYIVVNNLYTIKIIIYQKIIFLLIFSKVDIKLNENLKIGYFCTKPYQTSPSLVRNLCWASLKNTGTFPKILKNIAFLKNIRKILGVSYKNILLLYKNMGILRVSAQVTQSNSTGYLE